MFSLDKVLDKLPEEKKNEMVDKNVEGGFFFLLSKIIWFKKSLFTSLFSHKSHSHDSHKSHGGW